MSIQNSETISILQGLYDKLDRKSQRNGIDYFVMGRVKEIEIFPDIITAKVVGSASEPYSVHLEIKNKPSGRCSCPIKIDCKHIAATLISVITSPKSNKSKKNNLIPNAISPKSSKEFVSEANIIDPAVLHWINSLEASAIEVSNTDRTPSTSQNSKAIKRQILFILNLNSFNKELNLSLKSVKFKKNGEFAKLNQWTVNISNLWDNPIEIRESLEEVDWEIIRELGKKVRNTNRNQTSINFADSGEFLKKLIETRRCFFEDMHSKSLQWEKTKLGKFEWELLLEKDAQVLKLIVDNNKQIIPLMSLNPPCYYDPNTDTCGFVDFKESPRLVQQLLSAPMIKNKEINSAFKMLSSKVPATADIVPKEVKETIVTSPPKPLLKLKLQDIETAKNDHHWERAEIISALAADLSFNYDGHQVNFKRNSQRSKNEVEVISKNGNEIIKIHRKYDLEHREASNLLLLEWSEPARKANLNRCHFFYNDVSDLNNAAMNIIENQVPRLKKKGWTIEIDPSFPIQSVVEGNEWYLETEEQSEGGLNDWFDIKLGVLIDGERVNLLPNLIKFSEELTRTNGWENLDSILEKAFIYATTPDKKAIKIPAERFRSILQHLMIEFSGSEFKGNDSLRISKWNTAFLAEFTQGEASAKMRWIGSNALQDFATKIKEQGNIEEVLPPSGLQCELRPYQRQGLNWMQFLRRCNMNGILADDMGLGKTVQTLAHILTEKESGRMQLPVIVIAPTSLMPNWFNEAKRFAPSLKVLVLHGTERKQNFSKINDFDLILTTYPLLMRDKDFLLANQFHLMVLDEAQNVKNAKTQAYQIAQQIKANHRLCLSGTPMENHLGELWALFHLILPGFLGDQKTFQSVYRKPIEKLGNQSRRESLAKRIKPFILRRTKQQVAPELPDKTEIIQKIEFKQSQRDLYEAIRLRAQEKVMREIQQKGFARSQIAVLDALLKLRQVCCDPRLVKIENAQQVEESAKLECLLDMITQMLEENRKILIFSQFTSMLAIIANVLNEKQIGFTLLTGETKDRETPVKDFQSGKFSLMLISLKAGGVGLNLTAADTVIHYDPWWNPAAENQATDRAHRIGQTKAVFVYKLVVSGSVEEKIIALQERKKGLVAALMDTNANMGAPLTMEDLENIFQPLPPPI